MLSGRGQPKATSSQDSVPCPYAVLMSGSTRSEEEERCCHRRPRRAPTPPLRVVAGAGAAAPRAAERGSLLEEPSWFLQGLGAFPRPSGTPSGWGVWGQASTAARAS